MTHSEVCSLRGQVSDGAVAVSLLEEQRVALQVQLEEDDLYFTVHWCHIHLH